MGEALILASASPSRARLLAAAGIAVAIEPAAIDEGAIKAKHRKRTGDAVDCALALAEAKAMEVGRRYPQAFVIGADQLLVCGEDWFDKPGDIEGAREQLLALRGRTHKLVTAAVVIRSEEMLWRHAACPRLTMRYFSEGFLDAYLAAEGSGILGSVGAYRLEAAGIQLFVRIEGDYFSILGLPLLELLGFLRERGLVTS